MLSLSYIQRKVHKVENFKPKIARTSKACHYRMAYNMRLWELFNFAMMGYYNGGFLTAGDWLRVIILHHFKRTI